MREAGGVRRLLGRWLGVLGVLVAPPSALLPPPAGAQAPADSLVYRAFDLEAAGKPREAAPLFRRALRGSDPSNALLGLERVNAELGWQDSTLVVVEGLIGERPKDALLRVIKLRTLDAMGRDSLARAAFERWAADVPNDPHPYREYARVLLQKGRAPAADSVVRRAQQALGSTKALQLEVAQLRAALGMWVASAQAWRPALAAAPYLDQAATYALRPTPVAVRDSVRGLLLAPPVDPGARLALAGLEAAWGSAADGWAAIRDLPADSAGAAAFREFGERAEREGRWILARDAYAAALRWRRDPALALRAANAAVESGDPAGALRLAPLDDVGADSARAAEHYVPLYARAYALLGRPLAAEKLVESFDRFFSPGSRARLSRQVAYGWVRTGDVTRARAALGEAGGDGDSSETAGWLALYEGDLKTARALLRRGGESTAELALALGLVARVRADSAPALGQAFLALARGDTAGAATRFESVAQSVPDAASLLLATAARLRQATRDEAGALALFRRVVESHADAPEAPAAALELARAHLRRGETAAAIVRLEELIVKYPDSALLPQARRALEEARGTIPKSNP